MKRTGWFIIIFCCLLVGTMACSTGDNSSHQRMSKAPLSQNEQTIPLEIWIISNASDSEKLFLKTLEPYTSKHPELSVKVRSLSWDTAWQDITKAVKTGDGPDVLQLGSTWAPAIAALGGIADLTERSEELGGAAAYMPASWNSVSMHGDSKVYAIPWFVEARAIYYRKDVFQAAGLDPQDALRDWESFRDALKRVSETKINGTTMAALSVPGKNDWNVVHNIMPWVWGAGGDVLTEDGKTVILSEEQALQGIRYYMGLAQEGLIEPSSLLKNTNQIEEDFAAGKSAIILGGPWLLRDFVVAREDGGLGGILTQENLGIAPLPEGPEGRVTFVGGSNLAVFQHSEHKDEAWNLIAYLSTEEAQFSYAQHLGMLPARRSLLESPELSEKFGYGAFAEALQYGRSYPSIREWGAIETSLVRHFGQMWDLVGNRTGGFSDEALQEMLNAAAREIQIIMDTQ